MTRKTAISLLFAASALYDGILGLAFLLAPSPILVWVGTTPPHHLGYVQFPAALLIVFALMFVQIARDPEGNRTLIPYGILLKASYCSVVFWYWIAGAMAHIYKPFAVADLVFMLLFLQAYRLLREQKR